MSKIEHENLIKSREDGRISKADIPGTPTTLLAEKMRAWRIRAVSALSLSQQEWHGDKAVAWLREAQDVQRDYYYDEKAWERATEITEDPQGNEYNMAAEMCRDEGKYYMYVAALTGHSEFLNNALHAFEEAQTLSEAGTSAHELSVLEWERVNVEKGNKAQRNVISRAYRRVIELSPQAGGADRAMAASEIYIGTALKSGYFAEAIEGYATLAQLSLKRAIKFPLKEATRMALGIARRRTMQRIPSESFTL